MSRVNRAPGIPRAGITESLNAPGLAVIPPVSSNVTTFAQLTDALGGIGQLASVGESILRRDRYEREQEDRDVAALDRGAASVDYRTAGARLSDQINARELVVPDGVAIEDFADQIIASRIEGQSDAYREAYASGLKPALVAAFTNQQRAMQEQAKGENLQLLAEAITVAKDNEEVASLVDSRRSLFADMTDTEFYAKTVLPAMESAARNGDEDRFEVFADELGDRFPAEQAQLRGTLAQAAVNRRQQITGEMRNAVAASELAGEPFDRQREIARSYIGRVDESDITARIHQINEQERIQRSGEGARRRAIEMQDKQGQLTTRNAGLAAAGQAWAIEDEVVEYSDGGTDTISRDEQVDAAMRSRFAEIAAQNQDDPERAGALMLESAALNDYVYKPWQRLLSAGFSAASESTLSNVDQPIPPQSVAAVEFYRTARAAAPNLLEKMVDDRQREFYERTLTLMEDPSIGSQNVALAMTTARRDMASGTPSTISESVRSRIVSEAKDIAENGWGKDAKNLSDITAAIERHARYLSGRGISDPKEIARRATEIVQSQGVVINGWWSPARDMNLPDELRGTIDGTARVVIQDFAKGNRQLLEDSGLDADDLTLDYDPNTGFWFIVDARNGLGFAPMNQTDSPHIFTGKQLSEKAAALVRDGIIKANQNTRKWQQPPINYPVQTWMTP